MSPPLVLCHHALSDDWPAALAVRPGAFERQLRALRAAGYRSGTFSEVVTHGSGRRVAVSFDDAYRSVLTRAHPILARLGLTGTVFVPSAYVGGRRPMAWPGIEQWDGTPHADERLPLEWDELAWLAGRGWEVGSHTHTHPRLPQLDDAALAEELEGSRGRIADALGSECRSIAYPYGDVDDRVVAAAAAAGYTTGAALPARLHAPTRLRWPRIGIYRRDALWRFGVKVSPAVRRVRLAAGR